MTPDLEGIRGVLSRATGNGWEAAYRQDVGRLLDLVGELRLAVETGGPPELDRPGTYTPARGAEAEDLRREFGKLVSALLRRRNTRVAHQVQRVLDGVAARDSLLWLIERDGAEAIRERDALRTVVREAFEAAEVAGIREGITPVERIATLAGERDAARAEASALRERLERVNRTLALLESWTHDAGPQYVPTGGDADTFGDGVRRAQQRVGHLLYLCVTPAEAASVAKGAS